MLFDLRIGYVAGVAAVARMAGGEPPAPHCQYEYEYEYTSSSPYFIYATNAPKSPCLKVPGSRYTPTMTI